MAAGETTARTAARALAWACSVALVARHGAGSWQLARTLSWLDRHELEPRPREDPVPLVQVVVPVLREQQHVGAALAWWRTILPQFPGMSLTVVSTAREDHDRDLLARAACEGPLTRARLPQLTAPELTALRAAKQHGCLSVEDAAAILAQTPRTRDVVDRELADVPDERISHLTYPGLGRKAAQLNHAARLLPPGGYLAVYDVDSRPAPKALAAVYACLADRPPVVQQHALHTAPVRGDVWARGAAVLQSIWTLRREVPYARRHQHSATRPGTVARWRAGLSQPVGHGLYLRHDVLSAIGGFPENSVLDDVPTGVALTVAGIPTVSVPYLTTVPGPESAAEIIAQGRRWFCSYLDYPTLLRDAAARRAGAAPHRRLVAAVALYRGTAWFAASPVTVLAALAALAPRSRLPLRATAITGLTLATVVPILATLRIREAQRSPADLCRDCGALLAAYLLRSVGPWLAVTDAIRDRHPTTTTAPSPKAHRTPRPSGAPS
ncbi:glycosyltransferase family 2 protein [Actinomadura sp. 3N407]|uniref:glycosyltransferase family 2 protein n=1 Tax=Actinomadura sp. 3N407 TaxID=3457423 RepID=UPI003FCC2DF8